MERGSRGSEKKQQRCVCQRVCCLRSRSSGGHPVKVLEGREIGGGGRLCRVHGAEDLRGQAIFQTCEARP